MNMRRTAASAKREDILPFFVSCLGTGQKFDIFSEICPVPKHDIFSEFCPVPESDVPESEVPKSELCLNDERAACLSGYKVDKRVYLKITSADSILQFATLEFCKKLCFKTKNLGNSPKFLN